VLLTVFLAQSWDGLNLLPNLLGFWEWAQLQLQPQGITVSALLFPALVWGTITFVLKELAPKPTTWTRAIACLLLTGLGLRYTSWRLFNSLNLADPLNGTLSVILLVAEFLNFLNTVSFFVHVIFSKDRSAQADQVSTAVISGDYLPSVDVFIPTYNEPPAILRRTVIGCQAMDYPHKRIYLLDDMRRPEIRALAVELGCEYRDRPDNQHAKAGNINSSLRSTDGDLITIFDADFVPTRSFLTRTVGFFQNPKVAMVQTPQHFFNEDPVTLNLGLQGVLTNEQALFFRFIQPSRDALNSVVCCGTCFVIRRSALEEIGGIPTESITEDYLTSIRLQGLGYRILYLNEALAAGLSPETVGAYIDQRLRWGQGTLQCLYSKQNIFNIPGLKLSQRWSHSLSYLYWVLSIPRLIFIAMPLAFLLFGLAPLRATIDDILYFYLPYYLCNILTFSWLTGDRRSAFWSDVYETLICIPMSLTVIRIVIQPFGKAFKITPKGEDQSKKIRINWLLVRPLLILMGLSTVGLVVTLATSSDRNVNPDSLLINLLWTGYNLALLCLCILSAIDVPKFRNPRFTHSLPCQLSLGERSFTLITQDLSEDGAKLILPITLQPEISNLLGEPATLKFLGESDLAGLELNAQIRWQQKFPHQQYALGLKFDAISLPQQRHLTEFLFCQPGQWEELNVPEHVTAWAFLKSVLRLYPLAELR
jgi:cellulose synthase (UDP-forming)